MPGSKIISKGHKDKKQTNFSKQARITRMLLQKIPDTPIPEPYFTIPSPQKFNFPLHQTMLQGIQLLQNYFPEQINFKIRNKLKGRIQRLSKFDDIYCVLGKGGRGMVIGDTYLDFKGVTAYCYGPNYFIVAFDDLTLDIYTLGLKLIKSLKNFTAKRISFLKIIVTPQNYENIILLSGCDNSLCIHRIQKSLFSGLSHKYFKKIIENLEFPITQMIEISQCFKYYLRNDPNYRGCTLVAVSAINSIYILKISLSKLNSDKFATVDFHKKVKQLGANSLSWGQTSIQSPTRDLRGDKLTLTCTFRSKIYFIILNEIEKYSQDVLVTTKCEWMESYPFQLSDRKNIAFCQFMKKNQLLLVTQDNQIIIFSTRTQFEIFDKPIHESDIQCIKQKFTQNLQARTVTLIDKKVLQKANQQNVQIALQQQQNKRLKQLNDQISQMDEQDLYEQFELLSKVPLVSFADSFQYDYPSQQIYYLTQKQFGVYVYCDWQRISDHMKVQQRYESVMVFLIAIYKKVNKFDLGMGDPLDYDRYQFQEEDDGNDVQVIKLKQKQLSEYIQLLTIEFISNKLLKIRDIPQILDNIVANEQFFKLIIIPIQFLCETQQFTILFEVIRDKIISSLIPYSKNTNDNQINYDRAQGIFYTALCKFIEHGRIKYIPESQLQIVMNYYIKHDMTEMVDRLAIYFDLQKIDQHTVVQCLLQNNLVVSLAHICTQGDETLFITPFVRFWGASQSYKKNQNFQLAAAFALRSLWYMKLCLQRNWILKQYTLERYASMIEVLSKQFLSQSILVGLLSVRPQYCLQTLAQYFTIQNSQIFNQMDINFPVQKVEAWIEPKYENNKLELLVTTIDLYARKALKQYTSQFKKQMSIFLSSIVIHKTIKYSADKNFEIILDLIEFNTQIKQINYGLQEKMVEQYRKYFNELSNFTETEFQQILAARYIVRILTLIYYEYQQQFQSRFYSLYQKCRNTQLIDLSAEIFYLQNNFSNCIQIYMRASNSHKMLIYEFLQNCFKRLILEKRRQQKDTLSSCIKNQIKSLVLLNPRKTKNLIQLYVPQIQQQLILALQDDQQLQLDYLNDIMNDQYNPNLKTNLSEQSILRYIQLMSKYKPSQLLQQFKKNHFFPIEQSLKICEKYQVYDCIEYLYERMGCIIEAVKIAALRIDRLLKTRDQYEQDDIAIYIELKYILDNAIDICKKNHSEQIWQALLDSAIELYKKYIDSNLPQKQKRVFFYVNGQILENLAANCTIDHTIHLLQTKYNTLNMGGKMTEAFINILQDLSHMTNIMYQSTTLIQISLKNELQKDYISKLSCFRTDWDCETCRYPIDNRQKQIHFQCGHAYHKQCVVCTDPMTCVACLMSQSDQFQYYLNTLNPKYPKVKKVTQLFQKHLDKRLEMSQTFKVQQYEKDEQRPQRSILQSQSNKIIKTNFIKFDSWLNDVQMGNRRVADELTY